MTVTVIKWNKNGMATTTHTPEDYYSDVKEGASFYAIGWNPPRYPMPAHCCETAKTTNRQHRTACLIECVNYNLPEYINDFIRFI